MTADESFSLVCRDCDTGMEITCREEAAMLGWIDLQNEYEELNGCGLWTGICPDCRDQP